MSDNVKHPDHYKLMINGEEAESIDFVKAILGEEGFKKFCRGNALKYLVRADKKGGAEDLKKARVYINWEINDDCEAEYEEQGKASKPDGQLEEAFNVIKDNCKGYGNCEGCRFCEHEDCMLLAKEPNNWELPEGANKKSTGVHTVEHEEKENYQTQAKKAMEQLKAYCHRFNGHCEAYDGGEKCIFDEGEFCVLSEYSPVENWELPEEGEDEVGTCRTNKKTPATRNYLIRRGDV